MDNNTSKEFNLYKDIQIRTGGEIYLGIVGPVRTGKSTFIKRFMDELVLPLIEDEHERMRTQDELPQSSGGRTITTTEPKFIPKQAASVKLQDDIEVKVRLIDCVGFMVEGAAGHMEDDAERMVHTPWFDSEIPFTQAAEIGTTKVISDHSTVGIVITTDGSFGEIPREKYRPAEERTIKELQAIGKPFLVLVNSARPYSDEAKRVSAELEENYHVHTLRMNVEQMKKQDIQVLLEQILMEFPVKIMNFFMPKWIEMLPDEHAMKDGIIKYIREMTAPVKSMRDLKELLEQSDLESEYIRKLKTEELQMADGTASFQLDVDDSYYYQMLSNVLGEPISGEYELLQKLSEIAVQKKEYSKYAGAVSEVRGKGYGVVLPEKEEIHLDSPELIRHGNKYGVKMKAHSPSIHLIKADIETEIAPIVGSQEQAQDLLHFIEEEAAAQNGIWDTNIFGKTVEQLVSDGIQGKITLLGEESREKLQNTMQQIVNDSNGKMVCIII